MAVCFSGRNCGNGFPIGWLFKQAIWASTTSLRHLGKIDDAYPIAIPSLGFNNPIGTIILILLVGYIIFPVLIYALAREFFYQLKNKG